MNLDKSKWLAILEVVLVFIFIEFVINIWSILPLAQIQRDLFYWNYFSHIIFVLIPAVIIILMKKSFKSYGVNVNNWKFSIKWALIFTAIVIIPPFIAVVIGLGEFNLSKYSLQYLPSTLLFQIIFTGFTEEFLYRGYYQSRLNEAFDKPYYIYNLKFGMGVMIASFLFGFAHVLNPFNPLRGSFELNLLSGLTAGQTGFLLGLIREKTDSILAPSLIHGLTNGFIVFLVGDFATIFLMIGWIISWIILIFIFSKTKIEEKLLIEK
jgi:hypothetical protein